MEEKKVIKWDELWKDFLSKVGLIYKEDRENMANDEALIPNYHVAFLCGKCHDTLWATVPMPMPMQGIKIMKREMFNRLIEDTIKMGCFGCGKGPLLPLGYILTGAWQTETADGFKEMYSQYITTIFGKAMLNRADVNRSENRVVIGELKQSETTPDKITGGLIVPMPQLDMKKVEEAIARFTAGTPTEQDNLMFG